jgi:hypothetical protein
MIAGWSRGSGDFNLIQPRLSGRNWQTELVIPE